MSKQSMGMTDEQAGDVARALVDELWIDDKDLLIEAARYAVAIDVDRNRFMSLAKKAWFQAATEAGKHPQTLKIATRATT